MTDLDELERLLAAAHATGFDRSDEADRAREHAWHALVNAAPHLLRVARAAREYAEARQREREPRIAFRAAKTAYQARGYAGLTAQDHAIRKRLDEAKRNTAEAAIRLRAAVESEP